MDVHLWVAFQFRYSERVQEEWFEVDRNWISHSGVLCVCRRKIPRTKRCLYNIQHNLRKLRRGSTSRRSTSAWKSCPRNSRASSPWRTSSGMSLAYRRTPSSAWAYRTGSHPGSRIRPTWWPHGPCSACRFEIFAFFGKHSVALTTIMNTMHTHVEGYSLLRAAMLTGKKFRGSFEIARP